MIVINPHPPSGSLHLRPLRYDRQAGSWLPIKRMGTPLAFTSYREALLCAHKHGLADWREVHHVLRVVRVLVEHCGDGLGIMGVDARMVLVEAERVARLAEQFDENMAHLLSQPDTDHYIELDIAKLVIVDDDLADD